MRALAWLAIAAGCAHDDLEARLRETEARLENTERELAAAESEARSAELGRQACERAAAPRASVAEIPDAPPCERYLGQLARCNERAIASMPPGPDRESVQRTMSDAIEKARAAFSALPPGAGDQGCLAALDALDENPACGGVPARAR